MGSNGNLGDLKIFLGGDGSQIEVRMLAELSGDPVLISHFLSGRDVHCLVGHDLTDWPVERIAKEKNVRKAVKNMHFGIVFGKAREGMYDYIVSKIRQIDGNAAAERFQEQVKREQVEEWYDRYFWKYKGVARYQERMQQIADVKGQVETLFGFVRHIRKEDETRGTFWGNQAINTPIQGTAHQFLLIALALLHLRPRTYNLLQECLAEIHDELVFRVPLRYLPQGYAQLMALFQGAYEYAQRRFKLKLRVPLVAEAAAGFCLASRVDYAGDPLSEFLPKWRARQREIERKRWEELLPQHLVEI